MQDQHDVGNRSQHQAGAGNPRTGSSGICCAIGSRHHLRRMGRAHHRLPLLAQLDQRAAGKFTVDYVQNGPELWKLSMVRN